MAKIILQATAIAVVVFILAAASLTLWRSFHPTIPPNEAHGAQGSEAKDNHGKEDKSLLDRTTEDPVAFFTLWLTLFTGILAAFTIWMALSTKDLRDFAEEQARDMKESITVAQRGARAAEAAAKVARETLEASQRPFIFIRGYEANVLGGIIRVGAIFENSGSTPTQNMRARINWKWFPGELPADFDYPDIGYDGSVDKTIEERPAFVGPKSTTPSAQLDIPILWIDRVRNNDGRIFIYGWVEYDDLLPDSPRHRTEFCNELAVLGIGPDEHNPAAVKAAISFPMYGKHNTAN